MTDEDVRDHVISSRVSQTELEQFRAKRDEDGFANDSAYMRYLMGFDKQRMSLSAQIAQLQEQMSELTNRKG